MRGKVSSSASWYNLQQERATAMHVSFKDVHACDTADRARLQHIKHDKTFCYFVVLFVSQV
jgi:hypothetical protein